MNLRSATLGVAHKLFEIAIEMQQHLIFDRSRLRAQRFPIRKTRSGFPAAFAEKRSGVFQCAAELRVGQCRLRVLTESLASQGAHLLANNSARCIARTFEPLRDKRPPICIKQLASPETTA